MQAGQHVFSLEHEGFYVQKYPTFLSPSPSKECSGFYPVGSTLQCTLHTCRNSYYVVHLFIYLPFRREFIWIDSCINRVRVRGTKAHKNGIHH